MIKKLKKKIYIIFIKLVFQSSTFSFKDLIILDSEAIIYVFNDLFDSQIFEKHHAETISLLKVQKFQF